jgi:hypothetical protein
MTYQVADFAGQVKLNAMIHHAYPNVASELTAIATALGTDPTTHDTTLSTAPAGLQPGNPANSRFTNDILLVVNSGKGGNLTNAQMAAAIMAGIAAEVPPLNTVPPVVSGTGVVGDVLTTSNGTWSYSPSSYLYGWRRGSTAIPGASASTYTLQAADSGFNVTSVVQGINAAGGGVAVTSSNFIAVA